VYSYLQQLGEATTIETDQKVVTFVTIFADDVLAQLGLLFLNISRNKYDN
jgi:hypothetical protein